MSRTPILLWGDLVKGQKAITRRSLVGDSAHECMYAWVYLADYLATLRLKKELSSLKQPEGHKSFLADFDETTWKSLDRKHIDPHFQLNKSGFETSVYLNALFYSQKKKLSTIVELGQTFFTAIDKFSIVHQASTHHFSLEFSPDTIQWIGIDNSEFCNLTAQVLHKDQQSNMTIYDDFSKFPKQDDAIFHSRFVCSYAFNDTATLTDFLSQNFECAIIEDAFSTEAKDIHTQNHGQQETFFNLNEFQTTLTEQNYQIYLLDSYGDWPAGAEKCFVAKLLILKKDAVDFTKFEDFISVHGLTFNKASSHHPSLLSYLQQSISLSDWRKIYTNKRINPVWGKTDLTKQSPLKSLLKRWKEKKAIFKNGYRHYSLTGRNADEELTRFLQN